MLTDVSEVRTGSETLDNMYLTTRQYIPEDSNLYSMLLTDVYTRLQGYVKDGTDDDLFMVETYLHQMNSCVL
jgi:hypothetical protein